MRIWLRNTSCTFWDFSPDILFNPFFLFEAVIAGPACASSVLLSYAPKSESKSKPPSYRGPFGPTELLCNLEPMVICNLKAITVQLVE